MDRVEIVKEKWDYLIILDACRYDYFQDVYKKYLQGELFKKIKILKDRENRGSCEAMNETIHCKTLFETTDP